jgi:Tfp pilus assembly protein PilE
MRKQRGFTLIELVLCVWIPFVIAVVGVGLYVLIHFIAKFW